MASIKWPDYLGRKENQEINLSGGTIQVLEGSSLTLISETDRELKSATVGTIMRLAREDEEVEGEDETYLVASEVSVPIKVEGNSIFTGPYSPHQDTLKIPISWSDKYNLDSKRPAVFEVEPVKDELPTAYIEAEEIQIVHLIGKPFHFTLSGEDDLGLKKVGFSWQESSINPLPMHLPAGRSSFIFQKKWRISLPHSTRM